MQVCPWPPLVRDALANVDRALPAVAWSKTTPLRLKSFAFSMFFRGVENILGSRLRCGMVPRPCHFFRPKVAPRHHHIISMMTTSFASLLPAT